MEKSIKLHSNAECIAIYGSLDANLRHAEKQYRVKITARNNRLKITGQKNDVERAYRYFLDLLDQFRAGKSRARETAYSMSSPRRSAPDPYAASAKYGGPTFLYRGRVIRAKSKNQAKYLEAICDRDIVFAIGPAGTGKTYLAMACALDFLKKKVFSRIVLVRPAVEAGESLGFLPGDLYEKVNPYLRPLYDALYDMADYDEAQRYLSKGVIEVAPLAFMRGRTLNDSFVILDEAQNTSHAQMKMFLTRLGRNSKAVVAGDVTQIDLPGGKTSGLVEAHSFLSAIKGIQFIQLDESDVVRHPLVQEIIHAYEKHERK
ncbi:PhoH family protein [Omnitrophica bacterium]|nr:PhoH family protein [Candidatus Omnitrophota bacterium]